VTHHIFVYGTLRRGGSRSIEDNFPPADFVSSGCITGELYDLGPYPGLLLQGNKPVVGEVYQIDDAVLELLDAYEGCNPSDPEHSEYQRLSITALLPNGTSVDCHVYEISKNLTLGRSVVHGGDWISYCESKEP